MTATLAYAMASDHPRETGAPSIQRYARVTGGLMLLSMIFGFLGEWYIPTRFMSSDPATAAQSIAASELLYRFGFAAYLVEAVCDIGLALLFYVLLRPVSYPIALGAAFFGLVSTALYAVAEIFYFAPLVLLSGGGAAYMKSFSPDQVNGLVVLSLRLFSRVGMIFVVLYGIATMLRGYLIARSSFLPKTLGVLLMIAGAGFIAKSITLVLVPRYSSNLFLAPMFFAGLPLMLWLILKGVDVERWRKQMR